MKFPSRKRPVILNLLTGEARIAERVPFLFGFTSASDWRLDGQDDESCVSLQKGVTQSGYAMQPLSGGAASSLLYDGEPFLSQVALPAGRPVTLKFGMDLFAIALTSNAEKWLASVDLQNWLVFNGKTNDVIGTAVFGEVGQLIASSGQPFEQCATVPQGLESPAFWVTNLPDLLPPPVASMSFQDESTEVPAAVPAAVPAPSEPPLVHPLMGKPASTTHGEHSCPICWQHFEGPDLLHVATHPDLRGDELLGTSEMRRFVPSQFDEDGNPLDDFGLPAPDMACPHCHHRLPQGFLELPQNIFSMVGAPASGKSYYLAILIQELKRTLFNKFSLGFGDQDPEYNIELNAVSNRLFSALTPEQAAINKTQLTGGVYRRVRRGGQEVDLPKPYIFNCSRLDVEGSEKCIVFYDNAGEHFLPQNSTAEDYHILHMAKAASLFFLFDPVSNIAFKRRLRGSKDAQMNLGTYEPDSQDVILAQMNVKIKRALGLSFSVKIDVPLAVMVNKSDLWMELMEERGELADPVVDGHLDMDILDRNSDIIRTFMISLCPAVVTNAEKLCSEVRYFAISAFGHAPDFYVDSNTGDKMIAPNPEKIEPQMLEIPTIWALSKIAPSLVPTRAG